MTSKEVDDGEPTVLVARRGLDDLVDREPIRHDLVFGLVGAIGTPWDSFLTELEESLLRFNYDVQIVELVKLLDDLQYQPWDNLPSERSLDYYLQRMDAGDELRTIAGHGGALAALAIQRIARFRETREKNVKRQRDERQDRVNKLAEDNLPIEPEIADPQPVAYVLKSLKHPKEVQLLRGVYGEAFSLISVVCSADERRKTLGISLGRFGSSRPEVEQLILRDESDASDRQFGQNVRDTYVMADVYMPARLGVESKPDIDRYLDGVFGAPFLTPRASEQAMRFAQDASLRSAAASRQVGAALIPKLGTPTITGTNEVPKPGGGQYWEGEVPDFRDFRTGEDPNPVYVRSVIQDLLEHLAGYGMLAPDLDDRSGDELLRAALKDDESGESIMNKARAAALIEFTRCLHAEQAAIVDAARSGVSTDQSRMYTTTFPCHECAKMIIGAGIEEVYYIEPYPKSLVDQLFGELIDTSPPVVFEPGLSNGKVPFHQFVGIAPRAYARFFLAPERRVDVSLVDFDRSAACPSTAGVDSQAIKQREAAVAVDVELIMNRLEDSPDVSESDSPEGAASAESLATSEANDIPIVPDASEAV